MCRVIEQLRQPLQLRVYCDNPTLTPIIERILNKYALNDIPIEHSRSTAIALALTAPGTTTLRLALDHIPMVIFGQLHWFKYFIARYILRLNIPFVGLPNIISQESICPEYIQHKTPISTIVSDIESLIHNQQKRDAMIQKLATIATTIQASPSYYDDVCSVIFNQTAINLALFFYITLLIFNANDIVTSN